MNTEEYSPETDGVNHINIYTRGKTELGRMLSNLADVSIDHPVYGYFRSLEAFYYWLSTGKRHNELCKMDGFAAKKTGSTLTSVFNASFQNEFAYGLYLKATQNHGLRKLLMESTLPFTHYYWYGTPPNLPKIVRRDEHDWQVEEWEAIRERIKIGH